MFVRLRNKNNTFIECEKCHRVIKFNNDIFTENMGDCETSKPINCPCGNSIVGVIHTRKWNENNKSVKIMSDNTDTISHCPHCGSENIQLMRKKWSLMTGFLTNKVERYCVNCGKKF